MGRVFSINNPHVVHETIDGETILIHLGTGTYYSLDGVAAEVWGLLVAGASDSETRTRIQARYDADPALVGESVGSLVEQLLQEDLLTHHASDSETPRAAHDAVVSAAGPFVAPVLHKYTDMQEFMLVDPLHDVEADAGWPHVKTD
ncbi:MAG TPA: PqqD family protein [Solirubrobacteraceae bacterium]|nr:PqqD family protein [Solirubrobacteraceae bacterium]